MSHSVGITEALRSLPDAVVLVFSFVTQLGDIWFYFLALTLAYAYAESTLGVGEALDREHVAVIVALAVGAVAISSGLKTIFAHPRPPGADTFDRVSWLPDRLYFVVRNFATADGYSLPSGHAVGTAAVYGGAALLIDYGSRRWRYLLAGAVVATVAVSRVIIGVHYVFDVVIGLVAGGLYLAIVYWLTDGGAHVKRAFTVAVVVTAAAAAAAQFSVETLSGLGGALGGRLGWTIFGNQAAHGDVTAREGTYAAAFALPVGGILIGASYLINRPVVGFVGNALALAAVLGSPLVVRRMLGGDAVGERS